MIIQACSLKEKKDMNTGLLHVYGENKYPYETYVCILQFKSINNTTEKVVYKKLQRFFNKELFYTYAWISKR